MDIFFLLLYFAEWLFFSFFVCFFSLHQKTNTRILLTAGCFLMVVSENNGSPIFYLKQIVKMDLLSSSESWYSSQMSKRTTLMKTAVWERERARERRKKRRIYENVNGFDMRINTQWESALAEICRTTLTQPFSLCSFWFRFYYVFSFIVIEIRMGHGTHICYIRVCKLC